MRLWTRARNFGLVATLLALLLVGPSSAIYAVNADDTSNRAIFFASDGMRPDLLNRYVGQGVAVHYACATRGECGTVAPAMLDGYADVAALRTAEQECAARALGLAAVHFLGHRDSGMTGTPDNDHPAALVQAPLERVAGQLTALIRALRPQVV